MEHPEVVSQPPSALDAGAVTAVATDPSKQSKPPVVRGARACTVCRAAKMKCVGADDGQPCQRCKRSGSECIFEKHRRGRKPGSKLSEASKMLRRLEKGLNTAKLKSQNNEALSHSFAPDGRSDRFPNNELPPLNLPPDYDNGGYSAPGSLRSPTKDEDDDAEKTEENIYPAKLIQRERNSSFFKTILNPEPYEPTGSRPASERSCTFDEGRSHSPYASQTSPTTPSLPPTSPSLQDPISAGIIDSARADILFDLFFLRLNPFINLFDPALHTVNYVRSRCPFLFTTIIMACCKFFEEGLYKQVRQLANDFAVRAFAEQWKRVEICQAFACLTYWKEPEDNRTWTYIGYACRMAVELGLNRYVEKRSADETDLQLLERRNRERTYLVLFVHDRSLSTQTGRQWMLQECELVRHSPTWHEGADTSIRPEDVILAAFVQLRRIASETTDVFRGNQGQHTDMDYNVILRNCNGKLTQWADTWENEMRRANGEKFHFAFMSFFRLYVRLFLNSFGIQHSSASDARNSPSVAALSACYTSAIDSLRIVTTEFAPMVMLRYGQESITVMTAYSAVFLLKLLRSSDTLAQLHEGATQEIYTSISKTAEAYQDASLLATSSSSAAHHARFLRTLVANDSQHRAKQAEREKYQQSHKVHPSETRSQSAYNFSAPSNSLSPPSIYGQPSIQSQVEQSGYPYGLTPTPPTMSSAPHTHSVSHMRESDYTPDSSLRSSLVSGYYANTSQPPMHTSQPPIAPPPPPHTASSQSQTYSPPQGYGESDLMYHNNMFRELGFENSDNGSYFPTNGHALTMPDGGSSFGLSQTTAPALQNNISYPQEPRPHPPHPHPHAHQPPHHHVGGGHNGYLSHHSRHYNPYPPPSYNSHGPHGSYNGAAPR